MNKNFDPSHDYVRTNELLYKNTTTKRTYAALDEISYPQLFEYLAPDQKRDVLLQLQRFLPHVQQSILAEWQARCLTKEIRNPAAYLFGIIKKARAGEFRAGNINDY
ncbi:hypothetical protein J3U64_00050 [Snodgrassella sp. B3800]|uniref:hypothetical protein n=1 Tax=Snodgrassella sp. B3800 TaxID=2818039 RepID=UPI00226992E6|nr:hypothetical protein [Snodgrassella sp. B3800]MCX8745860.1 hypothetical protein [Snodgrassella sp. B3800]